MKYETILAALVSIVPYSFATKPEHICVTTGNAPNFELGGYNVPLSDFGGWSKKNGRVMVDGLWRKTLLGKYNTTIQPAKDFDPVTLDGLGPDTYFAFDRKNGQWRGVGVKGGDTEILDDEGLYITFGGLTTKEIVFGVRALFVERTKKNKKVEVFEKGLIALYRNGNVVKDHTDLTDLAFQTDGDDQDDGQEYFTLTSDVDFDAISFITYSHSDYAPEDIVGNHDYFLEYLDICYKEGSVSGDPHIRTWSGMTYDFQGVYDLVLLQNPDFENGLGMDIHVRTKQIKQFSYVSSAVLRIGEDTLEVIGDIHESRYWINGQANGLLDFGINGYPVSYRKVNSKQYECTVDLGDGKAITMTTFKNFVRVSIQGAMEESFGTSSGLLGSFGSGKMMARDHVTVLEDANAFCAEWQVLPSEVNLFHNREGPQAPEKCYFPVASNLRRRLVESQIGQEEAELACARVDSGDFEMCVFDVMATGDKDVAGAY